MIAKKCQIGSGFRAAAEYLMHGTNAREPGRGIVIDTNIPGATPREWSRGVAAFRQLRSTLGKAVYHGSLNPSPGDRPLSDAELGEMARSFLAGMGFSTCPYLIVRHASEAGDDGHGHRPDHIHILALRINAQGETVSDRNDYRRAEVIVRELETRFGLTPVPPSTTTKKKKETPTMSPEKKKAIESCLEEAADEAQENLTVMPAVGMSIECGETLDEKRKREFKRELLSEAYQQAIRDTFLDSVRFIRRSSKGLTIHTRDGGRLVDTGERVTAYAMPAGVAAERLIELALLKGWESIVLRGDEAFIREAMAIALSKGLSVCPLGETQLRIWLDVQKEHGRPAEAAAPAVAAVPATPAPPAPLPPPSSPVLPVAPLLASLNGLGGILQRRERQQDNSNSGSGGVPVNPVRPAKWRR